MTAKKKEWTRNRGKQPVGDGVWVEIRLRDKSTDTGSAGSFEWQLDGYQCDIMAWRRVAKPRTKKPEHAPRTPSPEPKPLPVIEPEPCFDAPRRPRLIYPIAAIVTAVFIFGAVCYVF